MAGNAVGNFSAAGLVGATSVASMFLVLSAVCVSSSLLFALLVRPRLAVLSSASYADPLIAAHGGHRGGGGGEDDDDSASLCKDMRELLRALCQRESLCLLPLLVFIGAENAFWSGTRL